AKRIGLSTKSGQGYISRLEKGKTKNPPIQIILLYLRACGASWSALYLFSKGFPLILRWKNH
ncbi:MAG: helix-turn-helix domain-containing protein, partial [bacterium]